MGFTREAVLRALQEAAGDNNRALDTLEVSTLHLASMYVALLVLARVCGCTHAGAFVQEAFAQGL